MISFLDPRLWLATIALIAVSFMAGDWNGVHSEKKKTELRDSKVAVETLTAKQDIDREMRKGVDALIAQNQTEKQNAKTSNDNLHTALLTGAKRLSVAVTSACPSGNTGAAATETRADLLPAVAVAIHDIGAESDDAVRDLNTCIDAYNAVRDTNNTKGK
jgi:prophage endopeptidase